MPSTSTILFRAACCRLLWPFPVSFLLRQRAQTYRDSFLVKYEVGKPLADKQPTGTEPPYAGTGDPVSDSHRCRYGPWFGGRELKFSHGPVTDITATEPEPSHV